MIYTCSELTNKLGSYAKLAFAVKRGEYFKVSYGLYSDKSPLLSELETVFAKYPKGILTLQSAFAFYEMSDYVPDRYIIATPQNSHKIAHNKIDQIYMSEPYVNIGKRVIRTKYGKINLYDKERMLIELFRMRSKLPYAYFKEVINSYRDLAKKEQIDYNKLSKYCSAFKNGDSLLMRIQEMIF